VPGSIRRSGEGGSETGPYRFKSEVNYARLKGRRPPQIQKQKQQPHVDAMASWGAARRSRAAESQDESRCGAIHKQRPYRATSVLSIPGASISRRAFSCGALELGG